MRPGFGFFPKYSFAPFSRTALLLPALLLASILLATPGFTAGQSARAFLESIYAHYQGIDPEGVALSTDDDLNYYFTPELARKLAEDSRAAQAKGDVPELDGDPFVDAQDWQLSDLTIDVDDAATKKTTAKVSFRNQDQPVTIRLDLVKIGQTWKINDIHWPKGSLRQLRAGN
ncbi:DUF3828 domain-containing protein [Dongia soli]|uniref:DUF3828 domain-containing protein n=1 Tax=Dongia soli TaxID=600628 RepID=A0ABU5EH80_9PROT|nr:DUF3828 domain-containing protein [Dongia soli]MDY0885790.1 DUF3828 domain-containing protein [Dongia soli]